MRTQVARRVSFGPLDPSSETCVFIGLLGRCKGSALSIVADGQEFIITLQIHCTWMILFVTTNNDRSHSHHK